VQFFESVFTQLNKRVATRHVKGRETTIKHCYRRCHHYYR